MNDTAAIKLDVCGICCPLPLIQLSHAVKPLKAGQIIEVTGDDPVFETSVRDFCLAHRHHLLDVRSGERGRVTMTLKVGG